MQVARLIEPVVPTRKWLARRIRESSAHFLLMRRKRRVVALWLITAHGAQIALLVLFLALQIGFPRVRDAALDRAIPESTSGKLLGLFGGESEADRRRQVASRLVTILAWAGGGSIVLFMFWICIPAAVARAARTARESEAEADALLGSTPSRSVMLYRSALALVCDLEHEKSLEQKLHSVDDRLLLPRDESGPHEQRKHKANTVAGRYTLKEELGRGANGVVYRAKDEVLGRDIALKELPVLLSNDEFVAPRFRQEARALARLNHPNIVQVYDFIEHQGHMWMAIELVEGGNLASYLIDKPYLAVPEACRLGASIAEAVAFAHERGVVHRDLKPLNILLTDEISPKVTDFGLAKLTEGGVDTLEGTVMGSPHYMSPEQAEGNSISHSTDIYSLGAILYRMLTGQVPFEGEIATVLAQHIRKPPRRLRDVTPDNNIPPKLEKLVLAMMAKSVKNRPAHMNDVTAALDRLSPSLAKS